MCHRPYNAGLCGRRRDPTSMEGDDEEYKVEIRHIRCGEATLSMLKLPESTPFAQKLWVFVRQLDWILYGTTVNKSNTLHDLESLECQASIRHYTRTGDFGTTQQQHKAIISEFNLFRKSVDALAGPAKRTSLLPLKMEAS